LGETVFSVAEVIDVKPYLERGGYFDDCCKYDKCLG
jgi:hypothetical protein